VNVLEEKVLQNHKHDHTDKFSPAPEHNHYHHGHEHSHDHGSAGNKRWITLIVGAAMFSAGLLCARGSRLQPVGAVLHVAGYLILGQDVLGNAWRNIINGRVMDENFLMSVATLGALATGNFGEAAAVMLFYQTGEFFQDQALDSSRKSIAELMDIRADRATVIRNGKRITVPPDDVEPGEFILIKPGEKVPLDGTVIDGFSTLDTSSLTGESLPSDIKTGDAISSGCINLSGAVTVRVSRKSCDSTVSKILALAEAAQRNKAPTEQFISKFARYYTPVVVALAVLITFAPPILAGGRFAEWAHRGLVFLVISCPCALVISIPLSFFGGIGAAARKGILIKGGSYLEALSNLKTVVFDKTATLTKGKFSVAGIIPAKGFDRPYILEMAAAAESMSPHPLAKSICAEAGNPMSKLTVTDYAIIDGRGVKAKVNGKSVLAGNLSMMNEHHIALAKSQSENLYNDKTGARVYIAINNVYAGFILLTDTVKDDSAATIRDLHSRGIHTVMLTGDNSETARAVAKALSIDETRAGLMPNQKVVALKEQMDKIPGSYSLSAKIGLSGAKSVFTPFKTAGKTAFAGDGINDAPSLALADVGIAMGGPGSDAALEAADVVLMTDDPHKIIEAIDIAAATKKIVWQNIIFSLGVKILVLATGAIGISGMWEAVFADAGVALIAILNATRILRVKHSTSLF
jgi:Cd2+/Zn2+-exporting ATPase